MTTRNERMISPHANGFKKYNADGIGPRHDFTQGRFRCAQSTLGYQKYNTDGVGSCAPFPPTNKTIHAIHPNGIRRPCTICPNETNHPLVIRPNETVGAAPVCPPERPRSGVSIPRIHASCTGNERWMRPCRATRAGTQAPPLPNSTKPRGVPLSIVHSIAHANHTWCPLPHRIAYSIAPNHAVCPYPIGVILSIAQGWQV